MSLEQALADNTAALTALVAVMKGAPVAGAGKPGDTKTKTETKKGGEHTKAEAIAALNEVKEKFGQEKALEIRNKHSGGVKMAELTDSAAIDALYDASKAALKEGGDDGL